MSGGNTSPNPQVSVLIPRPAFDGKGRMCQRHGSDKNSHAPLLVQKPLCNQLMHYHISNRGVFSINHIKFRNFAVVAMECLFVTVDGCSIMAWIHRWSVRIYGSLQAEFMETKYNSHIYRYGTPVFGTSVFNVSKSINNNNQLLWRLENITRFDKCSSSNAGLFKFLTHSLYYQFLHGRGISMCNT